MLNTHEQFLNRLYKSQSPLIVFPADWPGDAVAVSAALFLLLSKLGKKPFLAADSSWRQNNWNFLPGLKNLTNHLDNSSPLTISLPISEKNIERVKYQREGDYLKFFVFPKGVTINPQTVQVTATPPPYDLIITVGAVDLDALGSIYTNNIGLFYNLDIINLDHQAENEEFGQINLVDLSAATIAETLYTVLSEKERREINEDIATCLLAGIIAGTKNFKNNRLTPRALEVASTLIAAGGRREDIVNHLYRSRNFSTLKLWGKVLSGLTAENDSALVWSHIKRTDFQNTSANEDNLVDIIDELIANIPEARLITLIFEDPQENGQAKIILYATKNIDALKLLKEYHPQGNPKLAQAYLPDDSQNAKDKYLQHLKDSLNLLFPPKS